MGLFTGVESTGIVCSIIKNKLVAIWLTAVGTGLFAIFNQTIETVGYLTAYGIRQSSVREIAQAGHDEKMLGRIIRNVRAWSALFGMGGALLICALSVPLARWIMGDASLWWNFMVLGAVVLFNALYAGENAIFQGTENYRRLARTGLETVIVGLLISIPMFRFMGELSVIMSILAYAFVGIVFALINRNRKFPLALPTKKNLSGGSGFVKLGAYFSATAFIASAVQLAFISWLNVRFSTAEAGLYGAGMILVVRYTNLIFNSVGMEFYPRLSASVNSPRRVEVFCGHEASLLLLIFTPLVLLFILSAPLVVRLIYSAEYMEIVPFVSIGILMVLFKSLSNVMGFSIVARGDGLTFLLVESCDAVVGFVLCVLFYNLCGLTGIGVALLLTQTIYLAVVWAVYSCRYRYRLSTQTLNLFVLSLLTSLLALGAVYTLPLGVSVLLILPATAYFSYLLYKSVRKRRAKSKSAVNDFRLNGGKQSKAAVVMPVYNVAPYLEESVRSVIDQRYDNWELIMVDDGSTDGSSEMCDRLASTDSRIHVIHKRNGGPSSTRNAALDYIGKGDAEVIFFLDSDDVYHPDHIGGMVKVMESEGADLVACGRLETEEMPAHWYETPLDSDDVSKHEIYTSETAIEAGLYQKRIFNMLGYIAVKRSIFDSNLRFVEGIIYEDLELVMRILPRCKKVVCVPEKYYFYRQRGGSFMHEFNRRRLDVLGVTENIENEMAGRSETLRRAASDRRFSANYNMFLLMVTADNATDYEEKIRSCYKLIRKRALSELFNPKVRLKNRAGALLSLFGRKAMTFVGRRAMKVRGEVRG